jgi:hypothetical protein
MNFDVLNLKPRISWELILELGMDSRGLESFYLCHAFLDIFYLLDYI